MLSPTLSLPQDQKTDNRPRLYEIWIFAHPDHTECVAECGVFLDEREAARAATRLRMWLHLGTVSEPLFVNCRVADDRTALLTLPDYLRSRGIDPAHVSVEAKVRGLSVYGDNGVRPSSLAREMMMAASVG